MNVVTNRFQGVRIPGVAELLAKTSYRLWTGIGPGSGQSSVGRQITSGARKLVHASMSPAFHASTWALTTSTFSCDIARAVSRSLRTRRERLAPTAPRLRGPPATPDKTLAHDAPVAESPHPGGARRDLDSIPATEVMVIDAATWSPTSRSSSISQRMASHIPKQLFEEAACLLECEHALNRADRPREVELEVRISVFEHALRVPAVRASIAARMISTFSCDIARAVSRRLRTRRERLALRCPPLRGPRSGRGIPPPVARPSNLEPSRAGRPASPHLRRSPSPSPAS